MICEGNEMEEDGEETSESEENEILVIDEDEEQKEEGLEAKEDTKLNENLEMEGNIPSDDRNKTEDAKDGVPGEVNREMPQMDAEVCRESTATDEQMEGDNTERTENVVETRLVTSHHNPVATCDVVS